MSTAASSGRASQLIPLDAPLLADPKFTKDREDLTGRSWTREDIERAKPEAVVDMAEAFDLLETTLLADGRDWILAGDGPSLADIEGIWPFHWLVDMKKALPPAVISPAQYPKVFAWIARFQAALDAAKAHVKTERVKGPEVLKIITSADYSDKDFGVDAGDPSGLKAGQDVEVWPIDSGSRHHDRGRLIGLTPKEVVLETQTQVDGKPVHLHAPRHGFRIMPVAARAGASL